MANVERFNLVTGLVFGKLYESFPIPRNITLQEIYDGLPDAGDDEGYANDLLRIIPATMVWLHDNGYFIAQSLQKIDGEAIEAVLTPKGFEVLNAVPNQLKPKETVGDAIINLAKETAKSGFKSAMAELGKTAVIAGAKYFVLP